MDPLEAHFTQAVTQPLPPIVHDICPVPPIARLLEQPFSPLDAAPPPFVLHAQRILALFANLLLNAFSQISLRGITLFADFVAISVIVAMLFRTYVLSFTVLCYAFPKNFQPINQNLTTLSHTKNSCLYVKRRRKGLVGPSPAIHFIKFWSIFGLLECATHVLTLYLTPLNAVFLITIPRALILLHLCTGRRLKNAATLYDEKLSPFYADQTPEIKRLSTQLRKAAATLDDHAKQYAIYFLKHVEVAGLTGFLSGIVAADADERSVVREEHASGERGTHKSEKRLPANDRVFKSGRQFFAGAAAERAESVANCAEEDFGVVHVAAPEPPKPAYEDLHALRRSFSRRRGQIGKGKEKPP